MTSGVVPRLAMLNFIQINLHKSSQANILVGGEMEGKSQIVVLATEPHTTYNKITNVHRGAKSIFDRSLKVTDRAPRAGIIASKDVQITAMESWCRRDCAVALVKVAGQQTLVASIYLDINEPVRPEWIDKLLDMAADKHMPVLLGIDSNAHSVLYGPDNNARGDGLEDFILQQGLEVLNNGMTPTFEVKRGQNHIATYIDVTLARGLTKPVTGWTVDRTYNASDHNTIRFQIETDPPPKQKIRPWSKADWNIFRRSLEETDYKIPEGISMKKLDKLLDRAYEAVDVALNKACPEIEIRPRVEANHWSSPKHEEAKRKVSQLYKHAKNTKLEKDWALYKEADKAFKKMCKIDKNRSWRKYKECLQTEKEMASLAKLAQRNESRDINVLTKPDGTSTDPGKETIELLSNTHFPQAINTKHVTYNNRRNCDTKDLNNKYCSWIDIPKIKRSLGGFEKKKSPGPDGLKPLVFEHLPEAFLEVLQIIYKASIHLGYTPKQWKRTKVIFISKPGKETYDKPKSFRPISLSNYLLKGLERLVGWRMDEALKHNPIHPKQHGFLTGKSTESAVSNTTNYIEKFIMKKQHCVGVFLDISAAFDSIRPGHVRQALLKHGGDEEMVQWYYNYITHRDIEIDMHGETSSFTTGVGFPQGGVCSAKFWLIAFDYAIQIINRFNIEGNGYADDCSALYGGPRLDHALKRLQKMLNELTAWGKTCGLNFNPDKSVAVVFSRRRKEPPFKLVIDGKEIEYQKEVKYLGVTLDSKLHWNKHMEEKITKAKKYLSHVANITRKNWGPKPKLMRWAYLGIVRPMLCYGAMVWGHRAPENIAKLRRVNRMAINTFANFPRSTPTAALEVMLDVMPLHIFCVGEALAARIRLSEVVSFGWDGESHTKHHRLSHMKFLEKKIAEYKLDFDDTDTCNITRDKANYKINHDSFDGKAKHRCRTQFNVYTDGSRQNNQTGMGYTIHKNKQEIAHAATRLPDYATVFQAEISAIHRAAEAALGLDINDMRFVKIFIDSQAAILALDNPKVKSRAVLEAAAALNKLAEKVTSLTLVWIPAHKGHDGNERADELAKLGAATDDACSFMHIGRPMAGVKALLDAHSYEEWTKEWKANAGLNHSKTFYECPRKNKAKFVYKLARLELGRFARIITGHNNLNFFQHKLNYVPSPECRLCHEGYETITHLLRQCPATELTRREILGEAIPGPDMTWSVRKLLEFSYSPAVNQAYEGTLEEDFPHD